MANWLHFGVFAFLMVALRSAESCLPSSIQASVPQDVVAGYVISRVNLDRCGSTGLVLTSSDTGFALQRDGSIVTHRFLRVPPQGRTFSVWIQDQNGHSRKMDVSLSQRAHQVRSKEPSNGVLRRSKRRWSFLPFHIIENDSPPFPKNIERIGSDSSVNYTVYYKIEGPGVTEPPVGVFSVDRDTGMLKVNQPVDREQYPQFKFCARVIDRRTSKDTDLPLDITVDVDDVNDNAPTFSGPLEFYVLEQCSPGTVVGQVNATDRDDPDTAHAQISYSLLSGSDLFLINPTTGVITTKSGVLDREVKDKHFVTVVIRDMKGAVNGLSNTATATILLKDINDNPPTFKEKTYNVKIEENKGDTLLLRIPLDDKDLQKTPNWKTLCKITKGNETGNFKIETDPKTNECLLYVTTPLDYEKNKNLKLEVVAENEAPLSGTTAPWASIPVDVTVIDVDEGPEFRPPNLELWVEENKPNGTVIGTYTATDPETKSSAGMKYSKITDPASWIDVVENTGELKIANNVDRESAFVKNGTYNITVKAVDSSTKSGTGTVIIHVMDINDNIPTAPEKLVLCEKSGELGSVVVSAEDRDQRPFSEPFTFDLVDSQDKKWTLTRINGTAAMLQQTRELAKGLYSVPLLITDQQGAGEKQTVTVRICRCQNGACPAHQSSSALGVWGILAMLLAFALLLLLCIFCAIVCVKKRNIFEIDGGDTSGIIMKSNLEAPGDEVTAPILTVPPPDMGQTVKGSLIDDSHIGVTNIGTLGGMPITTQNGFQQISQGMSQTQNGYGTGAYGAGSHVVDGHLLTLKEASTLNTWNTNALFLDQKLRYFLTEEEGRYADDILHSYGFEGEGSPAGSVGCCSEQGDEDGLEFLNSLGPKFRPLAEICRK
ncbi:desmocollin-2-like [Megalops cyprinoides]|uniref:desmocollin-2-like n=1 Tax=Megalops cyprinoides TaxID=118141 RepID=UPI001863C54A|nr:desmocollin-2-like [Megalops cyprinoides]